MAAPLKCIVVDDEPLARDVLEEYIAVIDYLELVGVAENTLELDQALGRQQIDLIFLDIHMPLMTGLEFLNLKAQLPMVIITSANPNHALESFRFDVLDYLLKPITFNRFFKAARKALHYRSLDLSGPAPVGKEEEASYFFVKCESRYQKIYTEKILYVQAQQNYVTIRTETGKHMTLMPLKTIEEHLSPADFVRAHKSYLVAISRILTLENHEIVLAGDHRIPVSRNYRKALQERVLKNKVLKK